MTVATRKRKPYPYKAKKQPPYCPIHLVPMYANRSSPTVTRYYCRVDGCKCSTKVAR